MLHLVALAWIYVVLMVAVAEAVSPQGTLLGAFFTVVGWGVIPLALVLYILAKSAEVRDHEIANAFGFVTGHTLKHLIATAATAAIVCGLIRRFSHDREQT